MNKSIYWKLVNEHKCTCCTQKLEEPYTRKKCQRCIKKATIKNKDYQKEYHSKLSRDYFNKYRKHWTIKLRDKYILKYWDSLSLHDYLRICNYFNPKVWSEEQEGIIEQVIADNLFLYNKGDG